MHDAFKTWDLPSESLEDTEMRIHDGAPRERLVERGETYLRHLGNLFPWSVPKAGALVLEVGSGLGYVMQAAAARLTPRRVIGLDVAPSMIAKAKVRLRRDGIDDPRMEFLLYDGVTVPLRDDSLDYVYSVAALQHVPKVYVYNLLVEIRRILSPTGFCALHLLAYSHIRNNYPPFAEEVRNQLARRPVHWHHFYSFDELFYVLADGLALRQVDIVDGDMSIFCAFGKTGPSLRRSELAEEVHVRRGRPGGA